MTELKMTNYLIYECEDARGTKILRRVDEAQAWRRRGLNNAAYVIENLDPSLWFIAGEIQVSIIRKGKGKAEVVRWGGSRHERQTLTLKEKSLAVLRRRWGNIVPGWVWFDTPVSLTLSRPARIRMTREAYQQLRAGGYTVAQVNDWLDARKGAGNGFITATY